MKKKRSGKKKSNTQKSNNNGTSTEVTFGSDKHHNWSRPCSALAASISKEMFPSLPTSNNDTDDDMSTGKLLLTQQPLFAFMILMHMIKERAKILIWQGDDEHKDENNTHETKPKTVKTELDTLVDPYIVSNEALQILDNEAKRWGERDIESFVTYLTQKFDCHAKKMKKKSDKQCALQDMLNADALVLKDVLPTISIKDVSAHINSTSCRKCGLESATKFMNITSGLEIHLDPAIKENTSIILCDEGLVSPNSISKAGNTFRLELRPISSDTDRYLQIGAALNDMKDNGSELNYPINTQDIINLTKFIVLPKKITNADLGKEGLAKLSIQVKREMKDIEETLRSVKVKLLGIKDSLEPRLSFDPKTTKVLIGFDEQLDLGFQQLGYLLLQMFKLTSFVGWSATRGFKFLQFTFSLLERYNHALDTLIDPVTTVSGTNHKSSRF